MNFQQGNGYQQITRQWFLKGLKNAFSMPLLWLQVVTRMDLPLAYDHPEGPASCKCLSLVQNLFQNTYIHYLGSKTQKKSQKADCKGGDHRLRSARR